MDVFLVLFSVDLPENPNSLKIRVVAEGRVELPSQTEGSTDVQ